MHSCHNFPAGSREAARVARICETSLLEPDQTLTHCDLVTPDVEICIDIGSGNGLPSACTKPLPKPLPQPSITKISLKITYLKINKVESPRSQWVNSLAPGHCISNLKCVISNFILGVDLQALLIGLLLGKSHRTFKFRSTLVQVMAWCHQATSNYLNQCWP